MSKSFSKKGHIFFQLIDISLIYLGTCNSSSFVIPKLKATFHGNKENCNIQREYFC